MTASVWGSSKRPTTEPLILPTNKDRKADDVSPNLKLLELQVHRILYYLRPMRISPSTKQWLVRGLVVFVVLYAIFASYIV
ncbi:MAG TPA: hypothetical protein VK466_12010, partial [Terriglobales bacterium]|nr:hypothetical protein [Terriglobales bacterium]